MDEIEDHYATALKELVHDKMKGKAIISSPEAARPTGANIVDLMAALKRSLGQKEKGRTSLESKPGKTAKPKTKKSR